MTVRQALLSAADNGKCARTTITSQSGSASEPGVALARTAAFQVNASEARPAPTLPRDRTVSCFANGSARPFPHRQLAARAAPYWARSCQWVERALLPCAARPRWNLL